MAQLPHSYVSTNGCPVSITEILTEGCCHSTFQLWSRETAKLFVSRGMGKETVVYITMEIFSVIKEDWSDAM